MKTYRQLVDEALETVAELFPWDLAERLADEPDLLLLDVREPDEFDRLRIENSLNVPRGLLESACEFGFEDTEPELAAARDRQIVIICRSGNRSALAAQTLQQMGFNHVVSLKTGMRGWNDYEQPIVNGRGETVDIDECDAYFAIGPTDAQKGLTPPGDSD